MIATGLGGPAVGGLAYVTLEHWFTDADVATAQLTFRVEKAALEAWGADLGSVTLYRFEDGGRVSCDTHPVGEYVGAVYIRATFLGLSRFAVGADRTVIPTQTETATPTETAAGGATVDDDSLDGGSVESQTELGLGVLAILGLFAVLFGAGYVGGG